MNVKLLGTDSELEDVSRVLLQIRQTYSKEELIAQIKEQQKSGYQIAYVEIDHKVVTVIGFIIGNKLTWGRHIYIDDFVTDEKQRSSGSGKFLMDWLKSYAREQGCSQIHLDCKVHRFIAHRFYLREHFNIASHHFSVTDIGS
ncbi:MAG: GNAT family N-acetyltransferase [Desulfobacterales bacterium]|nr:GNAT family N-acetyltransferase [Desulfobacterales bacterium]